MSENKPIDVYTEAPHLLREQNDDLRAENMRLKIDIQHKDSLIASYKESIVELKESKEVRLINSVEVSYYESQIRILLSEIKNLRNER